MKTKTNKVLFMGILAFCLFSAELMNSQTNISGTKLVGRFLELDLAAHRYAGIKGKKGTTTLSSINFFTSDWHNGSLSKGAGMININGYKGVTFGHVYSPTFRIDKGSDTSMGNKVLIGSMNPRNMVKHTALTVDGRVYISEKDGPEAGFDDISKDNYKDYLLWVEEGIVTKDLAIAEISDWPDYVFNKDYKLPSLAFVEKNIKEKGHLHTMLSAKTIEENGFKVADMTNRILKTIEELTLHTINQEKLIKIQKNELEYQNKMIENLSKRLETLEGKSQK